jgi:hypothetical protein
MWVKVREARRSQQAQQQADDETLRHLIEASKRRLTMEAEAALQRLQERARPGGVKIRIFIGHTHTRSRILRRRLERVELTKAYTIWQVPYAKGRLSVLLMSDGLLYDDWHVRRSVTDDSPLLTRMNSVASLSTGDQGVLFRNPRRPRIQRHVDQIVRGLQQLGT